MGYLCAFRGDSHPLAPPIFHPLTATTHNPRTSLPAIPLPLSTCLLLTYSTIFILYTIASNIFVWLAYAVPLSG